MIQTATSPSVRDLVAATPPTRERVVDFLRVGAIAVVVLGHWLMAVVSVEDGRFRIGNVLGMTAGLPYLTWVLQVMPVFFIAGGFANAVTLDAFARDGRDAAEFVATRAARLLRPVAVLLAVWLPLAAAVAALGVDADLLGPATRIVVQPLWFIGVYFLVTALAPVMHRQHRRHGRGVVLTLAAVAVLVDLARFATGVTMIGYLNVAAVWLFAHQLGFAYADGSLRRLGARAHRLLVVGGLIGLVLLTTVGPYPTSMVGLPGEAISNMAPPTLCIVALTLIQTGLLMICRDRLAAWLERERPWSVVIAANSVIMTIFCWHLTAALGVVTLMTRFGIEQPHGASATWWLSRPLWLAAAGALLVPLVATFRRFERPAAARTTPAALTRPDVGDEPEPFRSLTAGAGSLLVVAGISALATTNLSSITTTTGHLLGVPVSAAAAVAVAAIGAGSLHSVRSAR